MRAQGFDYFVYFSSYPNCPHRIVLVSLRYTKKGHDRITDELFYKTFIFRNDLCNLPEDAAHDLFDLFRVESFTHCRVSGKIGENNSGLAAFPFRKNSQSRCVGKHIRLL